MQLFDGEDDDVADLKPARNRRRNRNFIKIKRNSEDSDEEEGNTYYARHCDVKSCYNLYYHGVSSIIALKNDCRLTIPFSYTESRIFKALRIFLARTQKGVHVSVVEYWIYNPTISRSNPG